MKNTKTIINRLTSNEDIRQELWVRYLEGASICSLPSIYKDIDRNIHALEALDQTYQEQSSKPYWPKLLKLFSEHELQVILLLTAGHDIISIARYKGIAEVKLRQMISVIRSHEIWKEIWPSKQDSLIKRNSD